MNKYKIGDIIKFQDIDYNRKKKFIRSGYVLHIKKDGSYITGNVFVPFKDVAKCLANPKHPLKQITLVSSNDLEENLSLAYL